MAHDTSSRDQTDLIPARTEARSARLLASLHTAGAALFPVSCKTTGWLEGAVLLMISSVASFLRLGPGAFKGQPWAEDGAVFIQQAHQIGPLNAMDVQYAGYVHFVPRLSAAFAYALPTSWQGLSLIIIAAVIQGSIALTGYVATAGFVRQRWPRLVVAACVVGVPVGPEVIGNVANLQWFLLFGAGLALLWTPQTWRGWVASAALLVGATTSSPFAVLLFAAATLRCMLQPSRYTGALLAATSAGFAIQTAAMLHAPPRALAKSRDAGLTELVRGFIARVLGDGVLGIGRYGPDFHVNIRAGGFIILLLVAALALCLFVTRDPRNNALALVALGGFCVVTYALPVMISGTPTVDPFSAGRYYVTPVLFLETLLVVLVGRALPMPTVVPRPFRWIGTSAAVLVLAGLAFGVSTSYQNSAIYGRDHGTSWAQEVANTREECQGRPGSSPVQLAILPSGWYMTLTCGDL